MEHAPGPYAARGLWSRLEQAFLAAGRDPAVLTPEDLAPLDHFHTGGLAATTELLTLAGPIAPRRVLDIGGGIGGPARYVARQTGASVVVADFTREFCRLGRGLCMRAGQAGSVTYVQADCAALPLASASFDLVWMQQANMNIKDKDSLLGEVERVLAPAGRYAFQEIMAGPNPEPLALPAAFAVDQDDYFLIPPAVFRARLQALGLEEIAFEDVTPRLAAAARSRYEEFVAGGPPIIGTHLLSVGDVHETTPNSLLNIEAGRMVFVRGVYRKPS